MASFLGVLKGIGKVALGIATNPLTPVAVSYIYPPAGPMLKRLQSAIMSIEEAHAEAGKIKSGAEKFSYVQTDFVESLDVAKEALRLSGKDLTYDPLALENAINMQVAALNAANKLKESLKIVDIAKA